MYNLFWNLHQQVQINEAKSDASRAKYQSTEASLRLAGLESHVERMALVNQALWELLRERVGLTDAELIEKVNEIDLRDGKLDGKLNPAAVRQCSQCGRTLSRTHRNCIYCGLPDKDREAFM